MLNIAMRRFYLQEFQCGRVALTWLSHFGCVNVYDNIRVVRALHGHGEKTVVVWIDEEGKAS